MRACPSFAIAGAIIALSASAACAQERESFAGPYLSAYGGASLLGEVDIEGVGVPAEADFDTGFVVGGALGYYLTNPPWYTRIEADVSFRRHDLDEIDLAGETFDGAGDINTFGLMVNYWIDIPNATPLIPYFGGGAGLGILNANDVELAGIELVDETDLGFAWQVGAGVAWRVTPQLSLSLGYRYFTVNDPGFETSATDEEFEVDYDTHNAMAAVRFDF